MSSARTNKDLPVEIWMRIFDELRPEGYIRSRCLSQYKRKLLSHSKTRPHDLDHKSKTAAMMTFPPFERQVWLSTRPFYAINHASRAAALRLRLSHKHILSCETPIKLDYEHTYQSTYAQPASGPVIPRYVPEHSRCLVVELYHSEQYHSLIYDSNYDRFDVWIGRIIERLIFGDKVNPLNNVELRVAKRIVILPEAPHSSDCCADWYSLSLADVAQTAIGKFFEDNGMKDRSIATYV